MYLRYISDCRKQAFYEDKYDHTKEPKNDKDSLVFYVIAK